MKTIALNIFGGPGTGKTTLSSRLFSELNIGKPFGEAAYVLEYAKELVYGEQFDLLSDQVHVTTEQCRRMGVFANKVGIVVTDSPVLLGLIYSNKEQKDEVESIIKTANEKFFSINIMLERIDNAEYEQIGRIQNAEEAKMVDRDIVKLLQENSLPYVVVKNEYDIASVVKHVTETVYCELQSNGLFCDQKQESFYAKPN